MHANPNTIASNPAALPIPYTEREAQLSVLHHAFTEVLQSIELREADPPMLDVLFVLNERFGELLRGD